MSYTIVSHSDDSRQITVLFDGYNNAVAISYPEDIDVFEDLAEDLDVYISGFASLASNTAVEYERPSGTVTIPAVQNANTLYEGTLI
jgi:hypothetical protein